MIISYFLLMAACAAVIASLSAGIIGSYVVVKRIVFISGSIAHSVLGGMGICLFLKRTFQISWLSPIYGALIMALLSAWLIGWIHIHHKQREDTVIASIWALGMSVGVIFVSLTPGYNVDLMNFLFGNILWTSPQDLYLLGFLDLFVLIVTFFYHKKFLAICFDEKQAKLGGLPVNRIYFILLSLIAIVVVVLIQIIGAILVISMLCLPAAIANIFCNKLSKIMFLAIMISSLSSLVGIGFSYWLNWPSGATIALLTTAAYLLSLKLQSKQN